eukprot:302444-Pyramimonas_sp.AAC.1
MAFMKGLTYQELAEATGEKERVVRFTLPLGSATALRTPRIRALRRVKALPTVLETRHRHQRRSTGFLT